MPAVAREKVILAVFERHALMRAAVHEGADAIGPTQDEDRVGTRAVWIKTARGAWGQLVEAAQTYGTRAVGRHRCRPDSAQCFSGGPLGNHFSRELNRNSCELSAPIGTERATHEAS